MELNITQLMDEIVSDTMKSLNEQEKKKPNTNYGKKAIMTFQMSKQHLKQSKTGLETYLDLLDKNEKQNLVSNDRKIEDFEDIDLPLSKEQTLAVIEEIDGILLRILAGTKTDVLENETKQKKIFSNGKKRVSKKRF